MPTLTPSAQAQDHRGEDGQYLGDERADEKLFRLLPVSSSLISGMRMIPLAAMTVPGTRTRLMIPMTSSAQRTMTARPVGNALSQTSQAAPRESTDDKRDRAGRHEEIDHEDGEDDEHCCGREGGDPMRPRGQRPSSRRGAHR